MWQIRSLSQKKRSCIKLEAPIQSHCCVKCNNCLNGFPNGASAATSRKCSRKAGGPCQMPWESARGTASASQKVLGDPLYVRISSIPSSIVVKCHLDTICSLSELHTLDQSKWMVSPYSSCFLIIRAINVVLSEFKRNSMYLYRLEAYKGHQELSRMLEFYSAAASTSMEVAPFCSPDSCVEMGASSGTVGIGASSSSCI